MKKPLVLLSSVLISTSLFANTPVSAASESNAEETTPYSYNNIIDKYFSDVSSEIKEKIQSETPDIEVNEKEYLTEEEVLQTDFSTLAHIYEELESDIKNDKYTDQELNQIAAKKIKNSLKSKKVNLKSEVSLLSYEIPGFGELTAKEVELAKKHPIEFTNYGATAIQAKNESEKYYGSSQLYQGNGDAFRHSFWNALMVVYFSDSAGPMYGVERATVWANAHEQYSSGLDKEMDLMNNEIGRYYAYTNYTYTATQFSSGLRKMVSQGTMARIVKGNLVATNSTTGK